jgi:diguanylate cyclase (GGDEF)-like protein
VGDLMADRDGPSLRRMSLSTATWVGCAFVGWALIVWAVVQAPVWAEQVKWWPLATLALLAVVTSVMPVKATTLRGSEIYGWFAFAFATLYIWGLGPALLVATSGALAGQLARRKRATFVLFNVGMYVVCIAAAWIALQPSGIAGAGSGDALSASTVAWMAVSWLVFVAVNHVLVAGLAAYVDLSWWEYLTEDLPFHVLSMLAVLALSPLIAIVAVAGDRSWIALLLLLLPLFAIGKLADASREQEHHALHDPLTGLPNRTLLYDRIDQSLARAARHEGRVVLMFLDLDHFKEVNDSLGHQCGDELLKSVAERVQLVVRPGDTFARYAGDEFVLLCEQMPSDEIDGLVDRLSQALRDPHRLGQVDQVCTVSIGYAVADEHSDVHSLIADADAAMYRAKTAGRDTAIRHE